MADGAGRTDWGQLYVDNAAAVGALAGGLSAEQLGTTVPGSPEWTVKQVVQHLAGLASDATSGRMDGAPGAEWTARHVAERDGASVADLVEELRSHQQEVSAAMRDARFPAATLDIVCHHLDLHEALGLGRPPERLWAPAARSARRHAPPEVAASDVDDYEVLRGAYSRRSRAQLHGWGTGADEQALDEWCAFGPREDDQPVPA